VKLSWNSLGSYVYSLDVKTPGGDWVGPCLDASILASKTSVTFSGVCTSSNNRPVPAATGYRLYFSRSNTDVRHWEDYVEVTPTSTSADVSFSLPTAAPSSVALTWNKKSETAEYSLDVFLVSGQKIRPCVNSDTLHTTTALPFDGNCTAGPSPSTVDLKDVTDFVICSAEGGHWESAACAGIPYSGFGTARAIPN
jgi:hypothetical protein